MQCLMPASSAISDSCVAVRRWCYQLDMRASDTIYLHASTGAGYLPSVDGEPVCVTVTHLDGIVNARSVFHH